MPSTPISFRLEEAFEAKLNERAHAVSAGHAARIILERYFYALEYALREIRGLFTLAEATAIADAVSGTLWEAHTAGYLAEGVIESLRLDALATRHALEEDVFTRKLNALTQIQSLAIVDALERWRGAKLEPTTQGFAAVGLQVAA